MFMGLMIERDAEGVVTITPLTYTRSGGRVRHKDLAKSGKSAKAVATAVLSDSAVIALRGK